MDAILEAVEKAMSDEPQSVQDEYRVDCIIREIEALPTERQIDVVVAGLDSLCALAKGGSVTQYAAGQLITRSQLIGAFLLSQQPAGLRIIRHG